MTELLCLQDIYRQFKGSTTPVLDGVNLSIEVGDILALIGETGQGKTTLARIITGLEKPDRGRVIFRGSPLPFLAKRRFADCAAIQYIFQDPYSALEAESSVGQTIEEAVRLCHSHRFRNILTPKEVVAMVGLGDYADWKNRSISSLSGGQRQRTSIARALIPQPELIIADEATSMLDTHTGLQIAELFKEINRNQRTSFIIISHQYDIIKSLCSHIAVLKQGCLVEYGTASAILESPKDTYTHHLVEAMKYFAGGTP